MKFTLPTYHCRLNLYFHVSSARPAKLVITGDDDTKPNTRYVESGVQFQGDRVIKIPLPQSPEVISIQIRNERNDWESKNEGFVLEKISWEKLGRGYRRWFDRKTLEFIDFMQEFSEKAGYLPLGKYTSDGGKYTIIYMERLQAVTPIRIHKDYSFIEISREKFRRETIPRRVLLGLHEFAHKFVNKDEASEKEADENAVKIFKRIGYPKREAVYASTELLFHDKEGYERMVNVFENL